MLRKRIRTESYRKFRRQMLKVIVVGMFSRARLLKSQINYHSIHELNVRFAVAIFGTKKFTMFEYRFLQNRIPISAVLGILRT